MISFWIIPILCSAFYSIADSSCEFPSYLRGKWLTSQQPNVLYFNNTNMYGIDVTKFGKLMYTCDMHEGLEYVARSEPTVLLGLNWVVFLCFEFHEISPTSYTYFLGSKEQYDVNFERFQAYPESMADGFSLNTICDRPASYYDVGTYDILLKEDSIDSLRTANGTVAPFEEGSWSFKFNDGSGSKCSNNSIIEFCSDKMVLEFNSANCSTPIGYSTNGSLFYVHSVQYGSTIYLNVYNDDVITDESATYRFSCFVLTYFNDSLVLASQHPNRCQTGQTPTSSSGALWTFTAQGSCPYPETTTPYVTTTTTTTIPTTTTTIPTTTTTATTATTSMAAATTTIPATTTDKTTMTTTASIKDRVEIINNANIIISLAIVIPLLAIAVIVILVCYLVKVKAKKARRRSDLLRQVREIANIRRFGYNKEKNLPVMESEVSTEKEVGRTPRMLDSDSFKTPRTDASVYLSLITPRPVSDVCGPSDLTTSDNRNVNVKGDTSIISDMEIENIECGDSGVDTGTSTGSSIVSKSPTFKTPLKNEKDNRKRRTVAGKSGNKMSRSPNQSGTNDSKANSVDDLSPTKTGMKVKYIYGIGPVRDRYQGKTSQYSKTSESRPSSSQQASKDIKNTLKVNARRAQKFEHIKEKWKSKRKGRSEPLSIPASVMEDPRESDFESFRPSEVKSYTQRDLTRAKVGEWLEPGNRSTPDPWHRVADLWHFDSQWIGGSYLRQVSDPEEEPS